MPRAGSRKFTGNENEIAQLLKENESWKKELALIGEEILFLNTFLQADIFKNNILNLYEKLQEFRTELEGLRGENLDLNLAVHNNRYDLEGMRECEDISCEVFYHEAHRKLEMSVQEFSIRSRAFRLQVFEYTSGKLRKTSKEH